MILGRRKFLIGLAAVPAVIAMPVSFGVSEIVPHLWGDGIHDDADALQWLMDTSKSLDKDFFLTNGRFYISRDLIYRGRCVSVQHCTFLMPKGHNVTLRAEPSESGLIANCFFDSNGPIA